MPEYELTSRSTQATLLTVVDDLEQGIEALSASLESLRATVRVVAEQVRDLEKPSTPAAPVLTIVEPASEVVFEAEPASDVREGAFSWGPSRLENAHVEPPVVVEVPTLAEPAAVEPAAVLEPPVVAYEPPAAAEPDRDEVRRTVEALRNELHEPAARPDLDREEIRRTVEATRAELSWSNLRVDSGFSFAPTEPMDEPEPVAFAEPAASIAPPVDDEAARREEVRLAVERARADMMAANGEAPAVDPEEARREAVRQTVERARNEMMGKPAEAPAVDDDEARREEVRRMVENTRGALSWSDMKADSGTWGQFKPEPGGFNIGPDQAPPRSLDSEAVDGGPRIVPVVPKPGSPLPKGADFNGPPIIVIEDATGRVELSQVFATLSKVDQSAQAALLNYSPHSVTIGLNMSAAVPDPNQLALAAQAVFGRSCSVKLEGNRTSIEVGTHPVVGK